MTASSTKSPLASIIVPVYNGEKYLRQSLDSILAQTYPHTEVLVMDDASTDATPAILGSYEDRLRVFRQPQNRGIYGNANDGIMIARGDYVAVYHADDVYTPTLVEREVEFLERYPEAGAVFSGMIFIDAIGQEFGRLVLPPEVRGGRPLDFSVVLNALLTHMNRFLMCPTAMVRATVYRELGAYRDGEFKNTSDMEMWLRIAQKYPLGILDEPLIRYRHFHNSSSLRYHHLRTQPNRFFTIVDKYLQDGGRAVASVEALAAHEAHRTEDQLMVAVSNYILGRLQEARGVLEKVRVSRLLGSTRIQRWRLLLLFMGLQILVRVPRIQAVSDLFYRRWHQKSPSKLPAGRGLIRSESYKFAGKVGPLAQPPARSDSF